MAAFQGQLTAGKQTAWGTALAAAPTRGIEASKFSLALELESLESKGVRPGRSTLSESQLLMVEKGTSGEMELQLGASDHGIFLEALFGVSVTAGAGPFTHTFTRASNVGKVLQFQTLNAFDTAASGLVLNYIDTKVMGGSIRIGVDEWLTLATDLRGRTEVANTPTLAVPSYAAAQNLFPFTKTTVTIDGITVCVESIEWEFDNAMDGDRYKICPAGFDEPAAEGMQADSVKLSGIQFNDPTHYNRFRASSFHQVGMTCVGRNGVADTFVITAPKCVLTENPIPEMDVENVQAEVDLEFQIVTPNTGGSQVTAVMTTTQAAI